MVTPPIVQRRSLLHLCVPPDRSGLDSFDLKTASSIGQAGVPTDFKLIWPQTIYHLSESHHCCYGLSPPCDGGVCFGRTRRSSETFCFQELHACSRFNELTGASSCWCPLFPTKRPRYYRTEAVNCSVATSWTRPRVFADAVVTTPYQDTSTSISLRNGQEKTYAWIHDQIKFGSSKDAVVNRF